MFADTIFRRIVFNILLLVLCFSFYYYFFSDIYFSNEIIINFAVHPFNICTDYPDVWFTIKVLYIPISFISTLILINICYSILFHKKKKNKSKKEDMSYHTSDLSIKVATSSSDVPLIIPESGLYQNFLITGTIGSGKTSSIMYPFTRQFIKYKYNDASKKLGMLILDVKGNYFSQVKKYAEYYRRSDDLIIIELGRFD